MKLCKKKRVVLRVIKTKLLRYNLLQGLAFLPWSREECVCGMVKVMPKSCSSHDVHGNCHICGEDTFTNSPLYLEATPLCGNKWPSTTDHFQSGLGRAVHICNPTFLWVWKGPVLLASRSPVLPLCLTGAGGLSILLSKWMVRQLGSV